MVASVASMIDQFNMSNIDILRGMGYEVHVAANFKSGNTSSNSRMAQFQEELSELNVPYFQIDFSRSVTDLRSNLRAFRQLLDLIRRHRYRFIHCHSPIGGVCGRIAGRMTSTPVVYTAHGFHFYRGAPLLNWLLYYPVEWFLARYTDLLIAINKEDYARARKFPAREVAYVPGVGIDTNKFRIDNFDRQKKRRELGIPDECFVILSVGELNKNKNHEVVIRALASMDMTNVRYLICGRGELEGYLRRLAGELGVGDKVRLLGFRTDMPEIYRAADVFVFPSFREGLPVALMEAMAAGLPVVCSSIRGNTDLVRDGENGYLVNPTDTDGFARYMAEVLNDGELRRTMGVKSVQLVQPFGTARVMHRMSNLYRTE